MNVWHTIDEEPDRLRKIVTIDSKGAWGSVKQTKYPLSFSSDGVLSWEYYCKSRLPDVEFWAYESDIIDKTTK